MTGINFRDLRDSFTEIVAQHMNYYEAQPKLTQSERVTAKDIAQATSGGADRYRSEPVFRAKVDALVSSLLGAATILADTATQPTCQTPQTPVG